MLPFPTLDPPPGHLPSHTFLPPALGLSMETEEASLPYCFTALQNMGALFYSSPLQTIYQRSIRAQPGSSLLVYHTNIVFNERKAQLQFDTQKEQEIHATTTNFQCLFQNQNISKDNSPPSPKSHKVNGDLVSKYPFYGISFLSII